ncbi:MAG: hypothetical protein AB1391_03155 [Candidatus Micrarchaeota archaeon]
MVSKGQLSVLDALIGMIGLMIIILTGFILFSMAYSNISTFQKEKNIELRSFYATEQLLSAGDPHNWNFLSLEEVNNFGMAEQNGVLDIRKITALNSSFVQNYSFVVNRLGLSEHNISIVISDYYTNLPIYSIGSANSTNLLSFQRISTINNSPVIVYIRVSR